MAQRNAAVFPWVLIFFPNRNKIAYHFIKSLTKPKMNFIFNICSFPNLYWEWIYTMVFVCVVPCRERRLQSYALFHGRNLYWTEQYFWVILHRIVLGEVVVSPYSRLHSKVTHEEESKTFNRGQTSKLCTRYVQLYVRTDSCLPSIKLTYLIILWGYWTIDSVW